MTLAKGYEQQHLAKVMSFVLSAISRGGLALATIISIFINFNYLYLSFLFLYILRF